MSVNAHHPDYDLNLARWNLVRDVVDANIKSKLRNIDPDDTTRQAQYEEDAILTNFTSRTKQGLVGVAFRRPPTEVEIPQSVDYLLEDATGNHRTLEQLAQELTGDILEAGRAGLLVDFPNVDFEPTVAQMRSGNLRAHIIPYKAQNIINWNTDKVGGLTKLTMVVLEEILNTLGEDGFTWVQQRQFRVLRLEEGVYTQEVLSEGGLSIVEKFIPTKNNRDPFNEIPFVFVGSENNDAEVDNSPLYDLARINLGHYRNSADYEESVHIVGCPTPIIAADMSLEEFQASQPNGVFRLGSRSGQMVGVNGSVTLLEATPNQLADEAMKRKEEQAVMTGAKLVMNTSGTETAEAARIRHGSELSVLMLVMRNVQDGLLDAIAFAGQFMSDEDLSDSIVYSLNMEFFDTKFDAQAFVALLQGFDRGLVAQQDMITLLKAGGVVDQSRTIEDIDGDIDNSNPLQGAVTSTDNEENQEDIGEDDS